VNLLPFFFFFKILKAKPAGRVTPDAFLFVQAATISKQKTPFSLRRASPLPGSAFALIFFPGRQKIMLLSGRPEVLDFI